MEFQGNEESLQTDVQRNGNCTLKELKAMLAREMETPEQKMTRRELQRLRTAKARNCETEEQRQKRLKANRERIARIRRNETVEQRRLRLAKQRERISDLRKIASDADRKLLRQKMKEQLSQFREQITTELQNRIEQLQYIQKCHSKAKNLIVNIALDGQIDDESFGLFVRGDGNAQDFYDTRITSGELDNHNSQENNAFVKFESDKSLNTGSFSQLGQCSALENTSEFYTEAVHAHEKKAGSF